MKKLLLIPLFIILAIALTGCGSDNQIISCNSITLEDWANGNTLCVERNIDDDVDYTIYNLLDPEAIKKWLNLDCEIEIVEEIPEYKCITNY